MHRANLSDDEERVWEDPDEAVAYRKRLGWSETDARQISIAKSSLESRLLEGAIGETITEIAVKNELQVHDTVWLKTALDAVKSKDSRQFGRALELAYPYDPEEKVFATRVDATTFRVTSLGWSQAEAERAAILPESLSQRGLVGEVGDTISEIAEANGVLGHASSQPGTPAGSPKHTRSPSPTGPTQRDTTKPSTNSVLML